MPDPHYIPHACPREPDEPGDEVLVIEGQFCPYCGWLAVENKGARLEARISAEDALVLARIQAEYQCSQSEAARKAIRFWAEKHPDNGPVIV